VTAAAAAASRAGMFWATARGMVWDSCGERDAGVPIIAVNL
jgi:hypothetical protein